MEKAIALILTLLVGGLVAFQPPANALLARHVGDLGAAFSSLLLSTLIVGTLLLLAGEAGQLGGLAHYRPEHSLGAIAGAAVVLVSLIAVRTLGALGVAGALVAMQLIVSALADRLAILGLDEEPLSSARLLGIALLIAGTALVVSR